jgi:hypothetical protein
MPMTTLVLNHILKFKILYILGFILLFVIYLLKQHIAIGLCFYIDIFFPVSSSGEEQNPRWPFLFSWIKNASKGKKGALSVERRKAIDFFLLDETSTEEYLVKKYKISIITPDDDEALDARIMTRVLRDHKKIRWYYSLLKGTMVLQIK